MRGKQTIRDMILSMAAIGSVVGVVYLFLPNDGDADADPTKAVDYSVEMVTAQRAAPYPVLVPQGLPEGWKPTSVSYKGYADDSWHIGFLDPDREYVAIEQSTEAKGKFVPKVTHQAEDTGRTQRIDGETWQRWEGAKYDALVRLDKGVTTVVTGTAGPEQLARMAAALERAPSSVPAPAASAPAGSKEPVRAS
ncbi:DUF4245 domain-containing protein [Streptomyces yaizuensis]|uniref:DUF4245 domain-containing protein n=1 Tax=Streptomyces yaizuensis TaxID=2989713 RepID=A0ABQ5NVN6_9ACTN|nr:DUF4245 domain-containing protein [Streptomyces sp. YSPA8]GLF94428.1 DUF4245 domain-containing protein [Streptomyces sp. YSPA8]